MTISKALRTGYYQALNGVVSVPVFDTFAPVKDFNGNLVSPPYIILSSQMHNQRQLKHCVMYDSSILVDIVTRTANEVGVPNEMGFDIAEDIAEEVNNIINPGGAFDIDLSSYGYEIGNTFKAEDQQLFSNTEQFYIYRQLLRYNHLIAKN